MRKLVYPTCKKFLGLVLTILPRTLAHFHQNVQPLGAVINDPNIWELCDGKSGLFAWVGCLSISQRMALGVWRGGGGWHMGMGLVWQDETINTFIWKFVLDLDMQILKCLTITCVFYCVMILRESQCQGSLDPLMFFCCCLGGFTTWCIIIIIKCQPHYLLTQLTVVFYTDVCQYSYQVKCIVVPCTVPLAMNRSQLKVPHISPQFPCKLLYTYKSRSSGLWPLCSDMSILFTVQKMKIMQSCNDTLASLLKPDCLNMRDVTTGWSVHVYREHILQGIVTV